MRALNQQDFEAVVSHGEDHNVDGDGSLRAAGNFSGPVGQKASPAPGATVARTTRRTAITAFAGAAAGAADR